MKKEKRKKAFISIVSIKALMSASTDPEDGKERTIVVCDDGSGYRASIGSKEIGNSKKIEDLFEKIFSYTHKTSYFHDLVLDFPQRDRLVYETLHTGQIRIVREYGLIKEEIDKLWLEFFKATKKERN